MFKDILENYTQDNSIPIIDSYFYIAIGITPSGKLLTNSYSINFKTL